MDIGTKIQSNNFGVYEIIEYNGCYDVVVRFIDTGYRRKTTKQQALKGQVRDRLVKNILGVARIGDGPYKANNKGRSTKAYSVYHLMIRRCYDKRCNDYHAYGARGVVVCDEWLDFQVFAEWFYGNYIEGFVLDKDLLIYGNKTYGPDRCCFLPDRLNTLLQVGAWRDDSLPIGVSFHSASGKYCAQCGELGNRHIGVFDTVDCAFYAYKKAKIERIFDVAHGMLTKGVISYDLYEKAIRYPIVPYPA